MGKMARARKMRARRGFVQAALQKLEQLETDHETEWMNVIKGMGNIFSSFFNDETTQTRRKAITDLAATRTKLSAECMAIPQVQAIVELSKVVSGSMSAVLDSMLGIDDLSLDKLTYDHDDDDGPEELDDIDDMEPLMPKLEAVKPEASCPSCSFSFPSNNQVEKHLMTCLEYKDPVKIVKDLTFLVTFDCPVCSALTDSAYELTKHFINEHNIMVKYFGCKGCGAYFHSAYELSAHWKKEGIECEMIPILWDKDDVKQKVEQLQSTGELSDIIINGATMDSLYGGMYAQCSSCQEVVPFLQYENHINNSHHDNWMQMLPVECSHPECTHYSANYVLLDFHKRIAHPGFDFEQCNDHYEFKGQAIMVRGRGRPRKDLNRTNRQIDNHPAIARMNVEVVCPVCEKMCSSFFTLSSHIHNHHGYLHIGLLKCNGCGMHYKTATGLKQHIFDQAVKRKDRRCYGGAAVSKLKMAVRHRRKPKLIRLPSPQPSTSNNRRKPHKEPAATRGIENMYHRTSCPMCNKASTSFFALSLHIQKKHKNAGGIYFLCDGCGSQYKTADGLKIHIQNQYSKGQYQCMGKARQLTYEQLSAQAHFNHAMAMTLVRERELKKRKSRSKKAEKAEPREIEGVSELYTQQFCPICQKSEVSMFSLSIHLLRVHPEVKVSFFKCKACSCIYKTAGGLRVHITNNRAKGTYRCMGQGTVMTLKEKLGHTDGMGEELNDDDEGTNDGMDHDDSPKPFIPWGAVKTECEDVDESILDNSMMDDSMRPISHVEVQEGEELNLYDLTGDNWAEEKPVIKEEIMDEMTY